MLERYILDDNNVPHEEPDPMKWAKWFETADRHVAQTDIGEYWISTVFVCQDHSVGSGPLLLFETIVFKGDSAEDLDMMRYTTHAQALAGHDQMVAKVRDGHKY